MDETYSRYPSSPSCSGLESIVGENKPKVLFEAYGTESHPSTRSCARGKDCEAQGTHEVGIYTRTSR